MADFEIVGSVVERGQRRGVQGVTVEAWDRDTRYHDMLGSETTDGAGRFRIHFNNDYFGDFAPDRLPDVFYRVFRDDTLVLSTQDHPSENQEGPVINVTLELDPVVEPEAADDRVSAVTAIKAVNFFRQSDFTGIRKETRDQAKLATSFLGSMLSNGFKKWDWSPITASSVKKSDVVNQNTQTAQATLAAQGVTVERVEPYNPQLNRDSARLLTVLPTRLQPGEKVVLYEENGRIKYYARVRDKDAASIDQQEVQRLGAEVNNVKSEVSRVSALQAEVETLKATAEQERGSTAAEIAAVRTDVSEMAELKRTVAAMQRELATRNQTIANLQAELTNVKDATDRMATTDLAQRVATLENRLNR